MIDAKEVLQGAVEKTFPALPEKQALAELVKFIAEKDGDHLELARRLRALAADVEGLAPPPPPPGPPPVSCKNCGDVQYPIPRVCGECFAKDQLEEVKLAKTGTVYTYTLDHLDQGKYVNTPVPRIVLDLEGGGRVFLSMTDGGPEEVKIGMTAEVVFRCLH